MIIFFLYSQNTSIEPLYMTCILWMKENGATGAKEERVKGKHAKVIIGLRLLLQLHLPSMHVFSLLTFSHCLHFIAVHRSYHCRGYDHQNRIILTQPAHSRLERRTRCLPTSHRCNHQECTRNSCRSWHWCTVGATAS